MPDLVISLLGPFEVRLANEPVTRFESMKVRALLAHLAAEADQPHGRAALAGLLWPDWPEVSAQKNLRQSLYSLRKTLQDKPVAPVIHADRFSITFQTGAACKIDTLELERALNLAQSQSSAVSELQPAVELYRGPFLQGFNLDDSPAYEEWILGCREHHAQQMLQALTVLTDWHAQAGEYLKAEKYARRQLELEPWRERAHQQLMQVLAFRGERVQALSQYENLRQALKTELGVEPSSELRDLYEQIRDGKLAAQVQAQLTIAEPPASLKPRHNLPEQLTTFVGREKEIRQVKALLDQYRLVTLTGSGGVGKSRLSLRLAEDLVEAFPNGIWLVELAAINDAELVVHTVANALGLRQETNYAIQEKLENYLKPRQMLLVLDNCEHQVEACAAFVGSLLQRCPRLKVLASSREALEVPGEVKYRVPSLSLPDPKSHLDLQQITGYDTVRLFVERAQAVLPSFQVTPGNAAHILNICQRLDGIPLALELAAARLDVLNTEQLAARLEDVFSLLTTGARTALPRHRTLHAAIDWSYQLLKEDEQTLLHRLSIFAGDWDLEAAEVVCAGAGLEESEILDLLAALVSKSLVIPNRVQSRMIRYSLLDTVRLFTFQKLLKTEEYETLRLRHANYYLDMAETYATKIYMPDERTWQIRIDDNFPNLWSALDWALQGAAAEKAIAAVLALWDIFYWMTSCKVEEGHNWLEKAASRIDPQKPSLELGRLWMHQGYLLEYQGRHKEAFELFQSSRDIFEVLGSRLDYAKVTQRLGLAAKDIGERTAAWKKASAYFAESATIFKEIGAENLRAFVLNYWANFEYQYSGDNARALELVLETERLVQELGASEHTYGIQGAIYWRMGQKGRVHSLLEKELQQAREVGDQYYMVYALGDLGRFKLEDATDPAGLRKAETYLRESLNLVSKFAGVFEYLAKPYLQLAAKALALGELALAHFWYTATLSAFTNLPPVFKTANFSAAGKCLVGLAGFAASQNALDYSARLLGVLESLQVEVETLMDDMTRKDMVGLTQSVRQQLGEDNFLHSWAEGQAMTLEQAVAYAQNILGE